MKLDLAGPMTGLPENNRPAFRRGADKLRGEGYEVVNPAELDEVVGSDLSWEWYMKRDIELLVNCDGVAVLDGWLNSRGACLEVHIARSLSMPIIRAADLSTVEWNTAI